VGQGAVDKGLMYSVCVVLNCIFLSFCRCFCSWQELKSKMNRLQACREFYVVHVSLFTECCGFCGFSSYSSVQRVLVMLSLLVALFVVSCSQLTVTKVSGIASRIIKRRQIFPFLLCCSP